MRGAAGNINYGQSALRNKICSEETTLVFFMKLKPCAFTGIRGNCRYTAPGSTVTDGNNK